MRIERIGATRDRLGEGPVRDARAQALYWIDIEGKVMHRWEPVGDRHDQCPTPLEIGSFGLRPEGGFVIAAEDRFHLYGFGDGAAEALSDPLCDLALARFNDGKVDRQGRFVAGTASRSFREANGALFRLSAGAGVERLAGDITVSNGPCWSPDGAPFYFADSPTRTIAAYDYPAAGGLGAKRAFVSTEPWSSAPDGATVDADGGVWSALVLTGQVARFAPDGSLDRLIEMPVSHTTSVAFGGPDLDILFVTSLAVALRREPPKEPEAGAIYAITDLGVTVLEEPRLGG